MPAVRTQFSDYKKVLAAAKKLTAEEKHMLWLELFSSNTIREMGALEKKWKKNIKPVHKTDDEIVAITTAIRKKRKRKS